jgi:hypothetical protein
MSNHFEDFIEATKPPPLMGILTMVEQRKSATKMLEEKRMNGIGCNICYMGCSF